MKNIESPQIYLYWIMTSFLIGIWCLTNTAHAQNKEIKRKSMVTGNTYRVSEDYAKASTRTRENYIQLYTRTPKGLLLGNKCAEDVRKECHFQYSIVPARQPNVSKSKYFFHNLWANIKLFFKNGPFWKSRMRKKIDNCREQTGDFVGMLPPN